MMGVVVVLSVSIIVFCTMDFSYLDGKDVHELLTKFDYLQMLNHDLDFFRKRAMNKAFTRVAPIIYGIFIIKVTE